MLLKLIMLFRNFLDLNCINNPFNRRCSINHGTFPLKINFKRKCIEKLLIDITKAKNDISSKFSHLDSLIVFQCINKFVD